MRSKTGKVGKPINPKLVQVGTRWEKTGSRHRDKGVYVTVVELSPVKSKVKGTKRWSMVPGVFYEYENGRTRSMPLTDFCMASEHRGPCPKELPAPPVSPPAAGGDAPGDKRNRCISTHVTESMHRRFTTIVKASGESESSYLRGLIQKDLTQKEMRGGLSPAAPAAPDMDAFRADILREADRRYQRKPADAQPLLPFANGHAVGKAT